MFFFSCIDSIIDEKFYESIHLQGSGWMDFYQNSSDIKRSFNDNYSTQIWFSGQENNGESAGCILNIYDDDDDISIYRNPNISNHLMIYVNDILFEEVAIENLNLDNKNNFLENIPLKKYGSAKDIAYITAFLCSDLSNYITGQNINIDGGITI